MKKQITLFIAAIVLSLHIFVSFAAAYTCNTDKAGPISIMVAKIEKITQFDSAQDVNVVCVNSSSVAVKVNLAASSIETVKIQGETRKELTVPANGSTETIFKVVAESGTYTAHYPVYVNGEFEIDGKKMSLKPVQVVETDFGFKGSTPQIAGKNAAGETVKVGDTISDAAKLPITTLLDKSGIFLPNVKAYNVVWNYDKSKTENVVLPVGFNGSDEVSAASFSVIDMNRGGVSRNSFSVHPPWKGGAGTMFTDYRFKLPVSDKIVLSFYGAIRDIHPGEPESDGVTYRVWVNDEIVCEKHIAAKTWVPVECDLTKFAGKEITLRLESDPGPKRDTTCDAAFWGDPMIFCGEKPEMLSDVDKKKLVANNLRLLRTGKSNTNDNSFVFDLDTQNAVVSFGNYGLLDGVIGFGNNNAQVQFDGLKVWIDGQPLGSESSSLFCGKWERIDDGKYKQLVKSGERELEMSYAITNVGPGLQISVNCSDDAAITKIEFGPATKHANRVYFGHGYCIEEPEAFQLSGDGHTFSTSHIGFDFAGGLSLLMASTFPPDYIAVDPKAKKYTMGVHPGTTFTFLPGDKGAMDCAIRYRPISDKKAASGVKNKAGRFALDWWGGSFTQQKKRIEELADYGVTDALVVAHNWQRWGYDNRLPDIWPPNPRVGTIEEIQEILELCKKRDILYGLHDNYIDVYPDADGFNYDLVSFEKNGIPRKAWNNYGIEAQSYQFRGDKILPVIERNFDLMTPHIKQTTYFVDVFSSIYLMDYWDREGKLHSRREMLDYWCKAFDTIRDRLGNNYPTISEAGNDFLIGHLDGADCQFMLLSEFSGDFRIHIKCKKWARIPWHDAVHHTRFSLHGVGYDSRYAANRGYGLHGYSSDDYIMSEILTGHPGQTGWNSSLRETVRKYWLTQPLIRELADKEITNFDFYKNETGKIDIHRQKTIWSDSIEQIGGVMGGSKSGSKNCEIYTNQGKKDWVIDETIRIPQYGFNAMSNEIILFFPDKSESLQKAAMKNYSTHTVSASILRDESGMIFDASSEFIYKISDGDPVDLKIVEYFNPRSVAQKDYLPVIPQADDFKHLGENKFQMNVSWKLFRSMKEQKNVKDYSWFLHLEEPQYAWYHKPQLVSVTGGDPAVPVSRWDKDQLIPSGEITLPHETAQGTYNVLVGLWDAQGDRQRAAILGLTPDNTRVKLGRLTIEKRGDKIVNMIFEPEREDPTELYERLLPNTKPIASEMLDAIPFIACRIETDKTGDVSRTTITPLPDEPSTEIEINVEKAKSVKAVDRTGQTIREVPFEYNEDNETLKFSTVKGEFSYRIE